MIVLILMGLALLTLWAIGAALQPPPCPGCGSRRSAAILLSDAVVCAGCWGKLA